MGLIGSLYLKTKTKYDAFFRQLVLSMKTAVRGDIVLKLTSPSGTTSKLLSMRPEDMETREK